MRKHHEGELSPWRIYHKNQREKHSKISKKIKEKLENIRQEQDSMINEQTNSKRNQIGMTENKVQPLQVEKNPSNEESKYRLDTPTRD